MANDPFASEKERSAERGSESSGALKSVAQAESLMQIAFVLPSGLLVGWGMGWCADHYLHWHWAPVVGLLLGIAGGMVSAVRMAVQAMNSKNVRGRR